MSSKFQKQNKTKQTCKNDICKDADVKADVKQQYITEQVAASYNIL